MTIECEASPVADPTDSATPNHAVDTCMEAWTRAYQSTIENNRGRSFAAAEAADAYQRTLPTLIGMDGIRSFIACVAHGMAIGAIEGATASRLLYAAQVAKGAHNALSPQKKLPG